MNEDVTVCIVDDDERVRNALLRLLTSAGFRARTYPSARALLAEDWSSNQKPTVVLADLRMPDIDGIGLAERLALLPLSPPIVFLSAHADVAATVRAMKGGAVDFLEKPPQEDELFAALGRAAARSRKQILQREALHELQERHAKLTPRERQVFGLIVSGMINKEAAWELGISEKTVKVHRARVVEKMRARSLPDLVRMAGSLRIVADSAVPRAQAHTS
jgi:FixJ family two-component response regulator